MRVLHKPFTITIGLFLLKIQIKLCLTGIKWHCKHEALGLYVVLVDRSFIPNFVYGFFIGLAKMPGRIHEDNILLMNFEQKSSNSRIGPAIVGRPMIPPSQQAAPRRDERKRYAKHMMSLATL